MYVHTWCVYMHADAYAHAYTFWVVSRRCSYHKIAQWADFVNAHPLPGSGIVDGLKTAFEQSKQPHGLLLLAQMSTKGNLITGAYTAATLAMAEANPSFVFGFISQQRLRPLDGKPDPFVYMTPGVKMEEGGDALGQQYVDLLRSPLLCARVLFFSF